VLPDPQNTFRPIKNADFEPSDRWEATVSTKKTASPKTELQQSDDEPKTKKRGSPPPKDPESQSEMDW